jgi:hypothetical protein
MSRSPALIGRKVIMCFSNIAKASTAAPYLRGVPRLIFDSIFAVKDRGFAEGGRVQGPTSNPSGMTSPHLHFQKPLEK